MLNLLMGRYRVKSSVTDRIWKQCGVHFGSSAIEKSTSETAILHKLKKLFLQFDKFKICFLLGDVILFLRFNLNYGSLGNSFI